MSRIENNKLKISRERNREHARKTRMKKKDKLKGLQKKIRILQTQGLDLKQKVQDCATASLLLSLANKDSLSATLADGNCHVIPDASLRSSTPSSSAPGSPNPGIPNPAPPQHSAISISKTLTEVLQKTASTTELSEDVVNDLTSDYGSRKRRRLVSLTCNDELHELELSPQKSEQRIAEALDKFASAMNRPQVDWKTGTYLDANGSQKKLSATELEKLRRERNRMHAKMTRDRKKLFVASIEQAVYKLESDNRLLREALSKHSQLAKYAAKKERLVTQKRSFTSKEEDEVSDDHKDKHKDNNPATYPVYSINKPFNYPSKVSIVLKKNAGMGDLVLNGEKPKPQVKMSGEEVNDFAQCA